MTRRGPGPIDANCTCPDGDTGWHYPTCIAGHGRQPDDTTRIPTTPSNDPPTDDTPVPQAEPFPLTDLGPPTD